MHMRSTRSHAKLLLVDTADGDWVAAVGSCNWLSSPFRSTEVTAVLRDPGVVADVAVTLQRMVGRRGLADDIANEMGLTARDLRRLPPRPGPAEVSLVVGEDHDALMREVTGAARSRLVVGSNRLGSTARPGVVMQGEAAVERARVGVTLLYSIASGPLKNRHARKLGRGGGGKRGQAGQDQRDPRAWQVPCGRRRRPDRHEPELGVCLERSRLPGGRRGCADPPTRLGGGLRPHAEGHSSGGRGH